MKHHVCPGPGLPFGAAGDGPGLPVPLPSAEWKFVHKWEALRAADAGAVTSWGRAWLAWPGLAPGPALNVPPGELPVPGPWGRLGHTEL